jgi:FAD synthase
MGIEPTAFSLARRRSTDELRPHVQRIIANTCSSCIVYNGSFMVEFIGTVQKGQQRGASLGFPTANVLLDADIPEGIYISNTSIDGILYPSLTFIGKAITFGEDMYQAETYILDFNRDIYGKKIHVKLLQKIRGNEKFVSQEALVKQMEHDKMQAEEFFRNHKSHVSNLK